MAITETVGGGVQARYAGALAQGRFEIQRCTACRKYVFYPRQVCPSCGAGDLAWVAPSGLGTVYSTTTVRIDPRRPYDVSLIDLDEGVRLMSRVVDTVPGEVRIGQRVRARVQQSDGKALLFFQTSGEAA